MSDGEDRTRRGCPAWGLLFVLAVTGCGRIAFDVASDAGSDAGSDVVMIDARGPGFDYPDFSTCPSDVVMLGNASCTQGTLQITPAISTQVGAVWFASPFALGPTTGFAMRLVVDIDVPMFVSSGDGMVIVMQDDPRGSAAIGSPGQSLGVNTIVPSLGVELDTFTNPGPDQNGNHVGIDIDGSAASVASSVPDFQLSDGIPFTVWIDYDPAAMEIRVYVDRSTIKPSTPLLTSVQSLTRLGSTFWVGLTASTQGNWQSHRVLSWSLEIKG